MPQRRKKSKKQTVLLIEDEGYYQKIYGSYLERIGFLITYCKDGEQAERALRKNTYDIVLLDLIIPLKSGIRLMRENTESLANSLTYILTVLDSQTDKTDTLALGARRYLLKSDTSPEQLGAILMSDIHST